MKIRLFCTLVDVTRITHISSIPLGGVTQSEGSIMMHRLLISSCFLIAICMQISAQQLRWEALPDFSAGVCHDMVETPDGALLLAGPVSLIGQDGRGLFRLEKGETSLQDVSPTWSRITALEVPGDGSLLCASEDALWRSENDGRNWRKTQDSLRGSFRDLRKLNDGNCYAITSRGAFFRSTDDGMSWDTVSTSLQPRENWGLLDFIGMTPRGWYIVATTSFNPRFSSDGGVTWLRYYLHEDSIHATPRLLYHSYLSPHDGALISAWQSSIERQPPDWHSYDIVEILPAADFRDDVAPTDLISNGDSTLYCGIGTTNYFFFGHTGAPDIPQDSVGILRSWDDGRSWSWLQRGLDVQSLLLTSDGELIVSTLFEGFRRVDTADGSSSAMRFAYGHVSDILCTDDALLVTVDSSHAQGVLRSKDAGSTWNWSDSLKQWFHDRAPQLSMQSDGTLLRGGPDGMLSSSDGGRNWFWVRNSLASMARFTDGSWLAAEYIWPRQNRTECTLYYFDAFLQLEDRFPAEGMGRIYDLHVGSTGLVIAAADSGLFTSLDRGRSWQQHRTEVVTRLFPQRDGSLLAGTRGALLASGNGGASWTEIPVYSEFMVHTVLRYDETIICSCSRSYDERGIPPPGDRTGIIRSVQGGEWFGVMEGLPTPEITCLAMDAQGVLYAGTRGCGMFRSTEAVTNLRHEELALPHALEVSVYPQPLVSQGSLRLRLPARSTVSITMRDLLGRIVLPTRSCSLTAGTTTLPLNVSGLVRGIYLLEVRWKGTLRLLSVSVLP